MRLVYLSPVPWASFAQRPHKFISWFHDKTGADVLWVNPYATRFPWLSDFRRLGVVPDCVNNSNPKWLSIISPLALPIEPMLCSGIVNALMWRSTLRIIDEFAQSKNCLLVIGKPSVLALSVLNRLKGCRSLYDAMDDFPAFYNGLARSAMRWREVKLVNKVDGVLASSTTIMRRWSHLGADVQLVQNGLDAEVMPQFLGRRASAGLSVFGYVGTIASWFDWDWVIALAKVRSDDVIRLIGPVFGAVPKVLPGNIELLSACNHQDAIEAMLHFDVGLIPFKRNDLTASVDPIKYYEYRALGLPVISTDFGEMALRDNELGTFISRRLQDIDSIVNQALNFNLTIDLVQKFRNDNTWEFRFDHAKIL